MIRPAFVARLWPRSLFGRLTLILFCGLVIAHALSSGLVVYERTMAARTMMLGYLAKDIASSVAILERVPASERPSWLNRLERRNYRYLLDSARDGQPVRSALADRITASIADALGSSYTITATTSPAGGERMQVHVRLSDGSRLTIELTPSAVPLSEWLPLVLLLQLALLAFVTWLAVRLATRPLAQLAQAADALGRDLKSEHLPEDGPLEVARAAIAFNMMQQRIADYLAQRMQILAAVSHDLQTPITRMRLRADLMDDDATREKLHHDLDAMQALVQEGIAYARSAHSVNETPCRIDLDALLHSQVCDYMDAGRQVRLGGRLGMPLTTRPHALRRIVTNLVDNALKFAEDVEITVSAQAAGQVAITVLDRGPGIPQKELQAVLQPFYRIESSRNRDTGGTGLGLAIAQQLAVALGGSLQLSNRDGGGLEARLLLPAAAASSQPANTPP